MIVASSLLALLASPALADDDLQEETVRREVDLRTLKLPREKVGAAFDISSFKGRYQLETECFRRLLPLGPAIRRCVDAQRALSGELHTRLDFAIEPDGKLKSFSIRNTRFAALQACLAPHTLPLQFPRYSGRPGYELQVLVASPGATLGGPSRRLSKSLPIYPIGNPDERRTYGMAVSWVFSPWSMAISRCAELVDQTLGFGYRFALAVEIAKHGRPASLAVEVKGKLASKALDPFLRCATPFVKAMDVPPHTGPGTFPYRFGTTTAGYGIR